MIEHILNSLNLSVIINLGYSNMSYIFLDKYVSKINWSEVFKNLNNYKDITFFLRTKFKFEDFEDEHLFSTIVDQHLKIIKLLIEKGANVNVASDRAIRLASQYVHLKVVILLLEKGADLHAIDDYSLRWASNSGHLKVVILLLERGAHVHSQDDSAILWASMKLHSKVVKILLQKGARISIEEDYYYSLCHESRNFLLKVIKLIKINS